MSIIAIEKRTRVSNADVWSDWASVSGDISPFIDTELVEYRDVTSIDITEIKIEDITSNLEVTDDDTFVVSGDGIFDKIMYAMNVQIKAQYDASRIPASDFAMTYIEAAKTSLQESINFLLNRDIAEENLRAIRIKNLVEDSSKLDKIEITTLEAQVGQEKVREAEIKNGLQADGTTDIEKSIGFRQSVVYDKQANLYQRQKASFDDNKFQKILESQLNYSGMIFQDAETPTIPDMATNTSLADIYTKVKTDYNI